MLARNCINGAASSWRGICLPGSSAVRAELCLSPTLAHRAPERWSSSSKFSGTHPRSPHLRKAKMLKATEPFYIPDLQTTADKCRSVKPPDFIPLHALPPHPFETVMAREARRVIDGSKVVVLCHRNPVPANGLKEYQNAVWKLNMRLWPDFNNRVLKFAVEGGRYAAVVPFLQGKTLLVTCSDISFADLHRGLRRMPQMVPLLVMVNGQYLLSVPQLESFAKKYKSGIVEAHGEFVSVLSRPTGSLVQALQHDATTLSQCLEWAGPGTAPATETDPTG